MLAVIYLNNRNFKTN